MKTIADLRHSLFNALDELSDKSADDKAIARARAVSEIAQTIINSAKVEVDFIRATGARNGTGFISNTVAPALPGGDIVEQGKGYVVRQHKLKG